MRIFLGESRENILGEFPDVDWQMGGETYPLLGGHRLWAAPEQPEVSYGPDASGLEIRARDHAVCPCMGYRGGGNSKERFSCA